MYYIMEGRSFIDIKMNKRSINSALVKWYSR